MKDKFLPSCPDLIILCKMQDIDLIGVVCAKITSLMTYFPATLESISDISHQERVCKFDQVDEYLLSLKRCY